MYTLSRNAAIIGAIAGLTVAVTARAGTQLAFYAPISVSSQGLAYSSKLNRLGDGTLVVAYGDTLAGAGTAFDVQSQHQRAARDVFVRTCNSVSSDCSLAANWTAPVDISNSALLSSIATDWQGTGSPSAYPGDAGKPELTSAGSVSVVTWDSTYCPGGLQRAVQYPELNNRVIPFSCMWASYSLNSGASWSAAQQLTSGARDATNAMNKGVYFAPANGKPAGGYWVLSWQEDPQGLQLGEAEGPGEGASGAKVSNGTDIWYAWATFTKGPNSFIWSAPVRVTDNFTEMLDPSIATHVYEGNGALVPPADIESGPVGASRPNVGLVGTTAILAYEETKGGSGEGKFVRYHTFTYNNPNGTNDPAGCIISDPAKNARRVRFVFQSLSNAMPLVIFWREGLYTQGGPADIVVRRAVGGITFDKLVPAVDANCETSDPVAALNLQNLPAQNVSSNTPQATAADLSDDTELNWAEDAKAQRALLRGDDLWIGYTYTPDLGALEHQQTANFNFWIRHFNAATGIWDNPQRITDVTDTGINVVEPRLVPTQGSSGSACPSGDPTASDTTNPTLCQNPNVFYLAWGEQTNVPESDSAGPQGLGLHITRTTDSGKTFEPVIAMSIAQGGPGGESASEAQFNVRPDGNMAFAVWNQTDPATGVTATMYTSGITIDVPDTGDTGGNTPGGGGTGSGGTGSGGTGTGGSSATSGSGGGGALDLFTLLGLLVLIFASSPAASNARRAVQRRRFPCSLLRLRRLPRFLRS